MKIIGFLVLLLIFTSCSSSSGNSTEDYCKDNPCKNSAVPNKTVCQETDNSYTCICEENYELDGDLCKLKETKPCDDNPCLDTQVANKTVCKELGSDDFTCECEPEYELINDECVKKADDLCKDILCSADKECKVENAEASCVCKDSFIPDGENCVEKPIQKLKVRVMAANLTTGMYQDYQISGASIIKAMKADIILIQEFNYDCDLNLDGQCDDDEDGFGDNSTSDFEIDNLLTWIYGENHGFHYYRGEEIVIEPQDIPIPNGIITRWPIITSGEWEDSLVINRNFNYAQIDIPGDKDLWAVSLHLKAGSSDDGVRNLETKELMEKIAEIIPEGDYIVIGGDLNTRNREERAVENLSTIFDTAGPHPVGEIGKEGTNASRKNPYDWVIASHSLSPLQISTDFCYDETLTDCKEYPNGLVFDSRKYSDYDLEVYFDGVLSTDSGADNMQHMGVIKDFEIEYQ